MNRLAVLAFVVAFLSACSSNREPVSPLADFHRIVAETNFITVSRWHPGVSIDVHSGFTVPCSDITCRSGDTVRASSYFSQILAETGVDREIEIGGTQVVEGHFEPGESDRTDDWRFLGVWMDHSAAVMEHQFNRDNYPEKLVSVRRVRPTSEHADSHRGERHLAGGDVRRGHCDQ